MTGASPVQDYATSVLGAPPTTIARMRANIALATGDKLAVLSAGAYGAVMASAYNTRPPAGEVLVHDGKAHLLRPARSIPSLLPEEIIPPFK